VDNLDDGPQVHFGTDVAQLKTLAKYKDVTRLGLAQLFTVNMVQNFEVKYGDKNFKVLETAPQFFELVGEDIKRFGKFLLEVVRDSY